MEENSIIQALQRMIEETAHTDTIDMVDIPNIDLYMDQVTTFMEEGLKPYKRLQNDKVLTKTMINNYAKAKIFPPPIKKKYTKNHMMLLIMIYHLKSVLSIHDINRLLASITDTLKVNEYSPTLEVIYTSFVSLQKDNMRESYADVLKQMELFCRKQENKEDLSALLPVITVLLLSIRAEAEKRMAEKILDQFF